MRGSFKFVAPVLAGIVALTAILQGASARQDKKANTGTIKGKVTGEDGKPAAKVNVRLFQPGMRGGRGPATCAAGGRRQRQAARTAASSWIASGPWRRSLHAAEGGRHRRRREIFNG